MILVVPSPAARLDRILEFRNLNAFGMTVAVSDIAFAEVSEMGQGTSGAAIVVIREIIPLRELVFVFFVILMQIVSQQDHFLRRIPGGGVRLVGG